MLLRIRRLLRSTRTDTLFPYTTLCRSRDDPETGPANAEARARAETQPIAPSPNTSATIANNDTGGPIVVDRAIHKKWRLPKMSRQPPDAITSRLRDRAEQGSLRPARTADARRHPSAPARGAQDRSEEHTSELQSLMRISYAVFCLKNKRRNT